MNRYAFMILSLTALSGCAPAEYTVEKLATDAKDNIYETSYRIQKWANTPPQGKGQHQPVASSYCYTVLQDILCYRQPMPGWENRLVAYQGTNAAAPPPALLEPLPRQVADNSVTPAARAAKAQPVFEKPPESLEDVKDQEKSEGVAAETTVDPTHEQLPDPAAAPQL